MEEQELSSFELRPLKLAKPVQPPNHRAMCSQALIGGAAGGPSDYSVNLSHYLPGGSAGPDSAPNGKTYIVLGGAATLRIGEIEHRLQTWDSCYVPPGTERHLVNDTHEVTTILAIVST